MMNSIKRMQSQACLNIAERKIYRLQAKKTIFALLALVMTSVTASAETDLPTYSLSMAAGAEAHGQITFKVGDQTATGAKEGETVTVQITPDEGWVVNKPVGQWYAAQAMVRRRNQANTDINIDVKNVFELEKLPGAEAEGNCKGRRKGARGEGCPNNRDRSRELRSDTGQDPRDGSCRR